MRDFDIGIALQRVIQSNTVIPVVLMSLIQPIYDRRVRGPPRRLGILSPTKPLSTAYTTLQCLYHSAGRAAR